MSRPSVVDYCDDANLQQLYTVEKLYGLPGFVKEAGVEDRAAFKDLPSDVFADPSLRKFPCHTKAATWLAEAYFLANKHLYSKESAALTQGRIDKFASYWGIKGLVDGLSKAWAKLASEARPDVSDADHALVVKLDDGKTFRRMPMPNAMSVKLAGEYLYANRFMYPYEWRKTAARRILKKAAEYDERAEKGEQVAGAALGATRFDPATLDYLEKAAGFGSTHPVRAAEKLANRVLMLGDSQHEVRTKLAHVIKAVAAKDEFKNAEERYKLAAMIDTIDRETGLYRHYHEGVDLPEEILFEVTQKIAEHVLNSHVTLTTGNMYRLADFAGLPLDKVAAVLGEDFAQAVGDENLRIDLNKFAEVAPTLPRPDAALLERILRESGRGATIKEARAALSANLTFDKAETVEFFKKQGKKVSEPDYTLKVPLLS